MAQSLIRVMIFYRVQKLLCILVYEITKPTLSTKFCRFEKVAFEIDMNSSTDAFIIFAR
ncbi:hypothetical protein CTI12_AA288210 [Artemisia annua]|uniref:Uncharacterized protein n=1 Tax=Artemisia annua TaxID=35608 RepID=A0A2U1NA03_ARTAN|nr:hypothetical protein CTI12_AA288210 [Artemisia annua]